MASATPVVDAIQPVENALPELSGSEPQPGAKVPFVLEPVVMSADEPAAVGMEDAVVAAAQPSAPGLFDPPVSTSPAIEEPAEAAAHVVADRSEPEHHESERSA
jgi:hypothetical protein